MASKKRLFMKMSHVETEQTDKFLTKLFAKRKIDPRSLDGDYYLTLPEWYKIETPLLMSYKKLKEIRVSLVEQNGRELKEIKAGGKLLDYDFNQLMAFIPHNDNFRHQKLFSKN